MKIRYYPVVFSFLTLVACNDEVDLVNNVSIQFVDRSNNPITDFITPVDNDSRDEGREILRMLGPTDEDGVVHYEEMEVRTHHLIHYDIDFEVTNEDEDQTITIVLGEPVIE